MPQSTHAGSEFAVEVHGLSHHYGERTALDDLSFSVESGEIFGLLGPNGGGKTTLFSLLASLKPYVEGSIVVFGRELAAATTEVRRSIGVVFQSPSVDPHLSVGENMMHQGHLYGLSGSQLSGRIDELLERFEIASRRKERVSQLSGGLRRRLEIAKALLHRPLLLILDEPSTGLDPGIRRELWSILEELRQEQGVTVLLTTHFMEEGDRCDRVGLLDRGRLAALGEPAALKAEVGGEVVCLGTARPEETVSRLREQFAVEARVKGETVRFEIDDAHRKVVELVSVLAGSIHSISIAEPTLEDVFLRRTGRGFWDSGEGTGK